MAKKTFDHAVIYGGVFYPANTPIEIKDKKKSEGKKQTETPDGKEVTDNDEGAGGEA